MKVAIMPGHGGNDTGAINSELNITEAEYNWKEATLLAQRLRELGHEAFLTRTKNKRVSLARMQQKANEEKADVCFCLHHNACNNTAVGWLIFCSEKHKKFGERAVKAYRENLSIPPLGAHPLHTFENSVWGRVGNCIKHCTMPTILVESCFIDSTKDARWLIEGGWKQIVDALMDIVLGIVQESTIAEFNLRRAPHVSLEPDPDDDYIALSISRMGKLLAELEAHIQETSAVLDKLKKEIG